MQGPTITTAAAIAAAVMLLASGATARGAGPGETFPTALIPLPAGAIAGGLSGRDALDYPSRSALSRDGRYVAFLSAADALSAVADPDLVNAYRKDRLTGEVLLASRANGADGAGAPKSAESVSISDDGSRVAWTTTASLDPADADGGQDDVYVRDFATGQTLLATAFAGAGEGVRDYDLSGDGAWIAFTSDERLAAGDANAGDDVYRVAVAGGAPVLVSARDGATGTGNDTARSPSISGDGTWVAFDSSATDLTPGFVSGGGSENVFARDVTAGRTRLVSNAAGLPAKGANQSSVSAEVAGSPPSGGSTNVVVAFSSYATDLAAAGEDSATTQSVYRRNLGARFTANPATLISRATGASGADADSSAYLASISDDGRLVVFVTDANNVGSGSGYGVYVRDATSATTTLGSVATPSPTNGAISGDGSLLAWYGPDGVTADSDPDASAVFARTYALLSAALGAPELVSRPAGSAPFLLPALRTEAAGPGERAVSADGRYVIFSGHTSRDLVGLGALGSQLYRRDTRTGALELVSRATGPAGAPSDRYASDRSISGDGTRVVFSTDAALDPSDVNGTSDVYVRDLAAATTTLVSRADGFDGAIADDDAQGARISADGTHVTFATEATNLGTPGVMRHVYLRDLADGRTIVVDRANGAGGTLSDGESERATPSADGRFVAFVSRGTTLDPADADPATGDDVYVRDTVASTTALVSRRSGADGQKATGQSTRPVISADGRVVAFETDDASLAPEGGAWAQSPQVVARDLATAANALVSRGPGGAVAAAASIAPSISDDGGVIAFTSEAANLLPGVGGGGRNGVFARTMATGAIAGPPAFGLAGNGGQNHATGASVSGDGQCLAFTAAGHNAISGVAGDLETAYVHVLSGSCPKALPQARREQPQPRTQPPGTLARPQLSKVSLLRTRFRVGKGPTAVTAAAAKRRGKPAPAGTVVRFTLSARANVTVAIERAATGRRVAKQCRRASRRLRRRPACTRWEKRGALVRKGVGPGRRSIAFSGRIGRRALAPGRYRAVVTAANAAGSAKPKTLAFTVVRR